MISPSTWFAEMRTYEREHIHVSTRTVCGNPLRLSTCIKQASRQALQLFLASLLGALALKSSLPPRLPLNNHIRYGLYITLRHVRYLCLRNPLAALVVGAVSMVNAKDVGRRLRHSSNWCCNSAAMNGNRAVSRAAPLPLA